MRSESELHFSVRPCLIRNQTRLSNRVNQPELPGRLRGKSAVFAKRDLVHTCSVRYELSSIDSEQELFPLCAPLQLRDGSPEAPAPKGTVLQQFLKERLIRISEGCFSFLDCSQVECSSLNCLRTVPFGAERLKRTVP